MKERLDVILTSLGLAESREKAKAIIMSGNVYVDGQREDKAGAMFDREKQVIEVKGNTLKYVSRGGLKLEKAVDVWALSLEGKICMDIGASTGGFTDCMLQYGAKTVFAVDVGTGQLSDIIKNNPRVISMENTNIVNCRKEDFSLNIDFATVDVSFVSLTKILSYVMDILNESGEAIILIKPQFEAGRRNVGRKGIVRDPKTHKNVIKSICSYVFELGFAIKNITFSPVKGSDGNIEYIMYISKVGNGINSIDFSDFIERVVLEAHRLL